LATAGVADHEAAQKVVRGVATALGEILSALVEQPLNTIEELGIDQRGMGSREPCVAEQHFAEVDAISKNREEQLEVPGPAASRTMTPLVEPLDDAAGTESLVEIEVKNHRHEGRLGEVNLQEPSLSVDSVAPWYRAAEPSASCGLALHPAHDTLDDRCTLELGEDAEHLNYHPASWRPGIKGLRLNGRRR
jgi:hypothetical protein